jgi:hypothetical protein
MSVELHARGLIVEQKKAGYLETGTNIAVILLAVTIISVLALNYYERRRLPDLYPGLKNGNGTIDNGQ